MISKWDRRFLDLAQHIAQWSKDPSTKVGAVIAINKHVESFGFNGFPKGHDDSPELYANREYKYAHIIHAELNAINHAESIYGTTMYTWPFMPCAQCAIEIIRYGMIVRVVAPYSANPRWVDSFVESEMILKAAGIELVLDT